MLAIHETAHISLMMLGTFALILFGVSNAWFYVRVLRPLRRLSHQAAQLERGEMDALNTACGGIPEIMRLRRSMAGMARHIQTTLAQTEAYADQLADGQERERKRLARELHDSTIQSLVAITQTTELAKTWLTSAPDRAAEMLSVARGQAVEAVSDLREFIADLRPPSLEELGLVAALGLLVERSPLNVRLTVEGAARRLTEDKELALFRVAQEGLNNAHRHSQVNSAALILRYEADGVTLSVIDEGRGFEVMTDVRRYALSGHYGLMGLHERLNNLGGTLRVMSADGEGTRLYAHLPAASVRAQGILYDPVCGMDIPEGQAYATLTYDGRDYGFCCPVCKGAFERTPDRYITPKGG